MIEWGREEEREPRYKPSHLNKGECWGILKMRRTEGMEKPLGRGGTDKRDIHV